MTCDEWLFTCYLSGNRSSPRIKLYAQVIDSVQHDMNLAGSLKDGWVNDHVSNGQFNREGLQVMALIIFVLALWFIGAALVAHLFCSAARDFVSAPEMKLLPVRRTKRFHE